MTDKSAIEYIVNSANSYLDQQDTVVEGTDVRPKRKTQVTISPVKSTGVGVFESLSAVPAQVNRAAIPTEIILVFEEVKGAFPWGAGDRLVLTKKA